MYRVWNYLTSYSLLLVIGAIIALVWANLDQPSYTAFVAFPLWENAPIGQLHDGVRTLTLHYLVNDILMAFFFAIAGKEVWEALVLKNGSLRGKKAATPLIATLGGMVGPITVYLGLAAILGSDTYSAVANGWAVPTATDIAFSYLLGRLVFGAGHPAVRFLLLLAIADDAAGLLIIAVFYPSGDLVPSWLLLSVGASAGVYFLANWLPRKLDGDDPLRPISTFVRKKLHFVPYLFAAALSWYGFMATGLHPALGLLPVVAAIPHADREFGIFSEAEQYLKDPLNQFAQALKHPVEVVLFFFALLNTGVVFSAIGEPTWLVLAGLLVGKPAGILLFGWFAARPMGLGLPTVMRIADLLVIGCVASIGFTVSLFIASVAFDSGAVQEAAKMGALLSFSGVAIALLAGRITRIEKQHG